MNGLRIIILGSPELGGSGMVANRTARGLAARGHSVTFLSYAKPRETFPNVRYEVASPAPCSFFPFPLYEAGITERLRELCMQEPVDVVHAHYATLFGAAAKNAVESLPGKRPRLVITLHGTDVVRIPSSKQQFIANGPLGTLLVGTDAVTAVSMDLAQRARALSAYRIPITVIPNAVDLSVYTPRKRTRKKTLQVVHVSNFRAIKQPELVVDTVAALGGDVSLALIGNGVAYRKTCMRARKKLGTGRVAAYGMLTEAETAARIAEADVLILPSLYESFSLAALEAQACGVPVVGTTRGGMAEVVHDGVTGILIDPAAPPETWADGVQKATELPLVRARSRENAERFSEENVLDAYVRLYAGQAVETTELATFVWSLCD